MSPSGFGLLLGALGAGAAVATAAVALAPVFAAVFAALVVGGASLLLTLSTLNASMQLSLPAWVRARGLSVYQLTFMGGQALSSVLWGVIAGATSSSVSLLTSAGLLVVCGLSSPWWPLHAKTSDLDLTHSAHWPEPTLVEEAVERFVDGEAVSEHYLAVRDVG